MSTQTNKRERGSDDDSGRDVAPRLQENADLLANAQPQSCHFAIDESQLSKNFQLQ